MNALNERLKSRLAEAKEMAKPRTYVNQNTRGTVILKRAVFKEDGFKGTSAIFELEVETSEGKSAKPGFEAGVAHAKGEDFAFVVTKLSTDDKAKRDAAWGKLKTALQSIGHSLFGRKLDTEELQELMDSVFSPDQIGRGVRLSYNTNDKAPSAEYPKAITFLMLDAIGDNSPEQVKARRADLDQRKPIV